MEIIQKLTGPGGDFELRDEEVLGARLPVFANRARDLGEVLARSASFGDRDYLVTASGRLSFAEHARRVASMAKALRDDLGVRPGDRIAINAANSPEWLVSFWAAIAAGGVAVGYNAWWAPQEIEYALGHTDPTVVIADEKRAALISENVLTVETDVPSLTSRYPDAELDIPDIREDDPAVILYTSGTSGRPKGAVHSHRNLTSVIEYHRFNDAMMDMFGIDPSTRRYLLALPLFHIASLHNLAVPRLATGTAVVMHRGAFDVDKVLALIEKERVTNWGAVPTMARRMMEHPDLSKYDVSSLTAFALASAPSSVALKERLQKVFPPARGSLVDSYGLTESCTAISVATPMDLAEAPGTVGRPVIGVEMEIRDPDGRPVPEGVEGEVCARSAYNMVGYWRDPDATAAALDADRWLRTGDIGVVEDGRLRLTTRRSDLIIRGGENVYPVEVESVLTEHRGVRECMVLGAPHPDLGQEVAAVVVARGPLPATEDLTAFARERLAYYKVPTRWTITTEPLPRNATGKILRKRVADEFA
ncbi:class I adenylate-forming enzyme family protein [Actinomadura sp. 6K520]|uniref:class I adenylate-forming enzyme family protein n=1 Tax=Actinomadura sp. 6K520 TaxID=2530364 RepID=UPI001044503A|nr:class I adenylate-forming enzyme family protein [Actinomadura sp. 6K520]TDE27414.1 long-chain fatty acid--CoA ligase [Actinomadura sp. 6K520]